MKTNSWRMILTLALAAILWNGMNNSNSCLACNPVPDTTYIEDYNCGTLDLSGETLFWPAQNTYYITISTDATYPRTLYITNGTLFIEPGAIVKLDPNVNIMTGTGGKIIACGKPYQPIIFTSSHDKNLGQIVISDIAVSENEYFDSIEIGADSKMEYCRIMYGEWGIKVSGLPGSKIQHNVIWNCLEGIEIASTAISGSSDKVTLFNNLIYSCEQGVVIPGLSSTGGTVDIYNNTIDSCTAKGVYINSTPSSKVLIKNTLFTNMNDTEIYAIYDTDTSSDPNMSNNAYYRCQKYNCSWGSSYISLADNNNPYNTANTALGSHYLNSNNPGGVSLLDAGSGTVTAVGYDDPNDWALKYPLSVITSDPAYVEDQTWEPNTIICDSGTVAIGYHHPRVDVLIYHTKVTFSDIDLTINPGTVIAQFPVRGTNDDYIDINSNCSLTCTGDPFGAGEVIFVQGGLASESGVDAYYHRYDPFLVIESAAGTATISHAKYLAVSEAVNFSRSVTLSNCTFWLDRCAVTDSYSAVGTDTSTLTNCLFVENLAGVYLANSAANLDIVNCSFTQEDLPGGDIYYAEDTYGIYGEAGCTFSIVNCLFDELEYGLAGAGNCTENNNAFYHVYDPTHFNGYNLSATDKTLLINPFIAQADWIEKSEKRFYLDQSSEAVNHGNSTTSGFEGGSTDITYPLDPKPIDIGYHYLRQTVYVDRTVDPSGDGKTWATAKKTIQEGITAAGSAGAEIVLVANGTYTGTGNKNLTCGDKAMIIQSLNGVNYCTINCENSGRGFTITNNTGEDLVIMGFKIINGSSTEGGGIYISGCSQFGVKIINCRLEANTASNAGGGIYSNGSAFTMVNDVLYNNYATNKGGGVYSFNSDLVLTNCSLIYNRANPEDSDAIGGGICNNDPVTSSSSALLLRNCNLFNNRAGHGGAGNFYSSEIWSPISGAYSYSTRVFDSNIQFGYYSSAPDINDHIVGRILPYPTVNLYTWPANDPNGIPANSHLIEIGDGEHNWWTYSEAGTNGKHIPPKWLKTDILGNPRFKDGNADGTVKIDIGAYEYNP